MGHTNNYIVINEEINKVFDITNDIDNWKNLFSEYEESKVLKKEDNKLTFQLTLKPEGDRPARTWISQRILDKANYRCEAERIEPKYPFEYMKIFWEYNTLPEGTKMTWVQDFKVHEDCPWDDKKMEDHLNKNTKIQMQIIKERIENTN